MLDPALQRPKGAAMPKPAVFFDDPLEPDSPDDRGLIVTRRGLCRLVTVAAEVGARFQREAERTDPVAWMLAPRRLFGGAAAVEACLRHEHFYRALVLHGLSLGVDADPGGFPVLAQAQDGRRELGRPRRGRSTRRRSQAQLQLYTATIVFAGGGVMLQAFHASVAVHPAEVIERLRRRFGDDVLEHVDMRVGFDPAMPIVVALVPEGVARMIREVEAACSEPGARSFAVDIEQRLEA
ncbi:hypothetical protein [Sphingomonas beigongshangi]|uniref:hypothetical protein n=1 Tax=Sphingomonas beigongshangi TaxID=2782540 RepID=UPI001AED3D07|nr:hypothetical protein [Sphingomonas beigongshangi]